MKLRVQAESLNPRPSVFCSGAAARCPPRMRPAGKIPNPVSQAALQAVQRQGGGRSCTRLLPGSPEEARKGGSSLHQHLLLGALAPSHARDVGLYLAPACRLWIWGFVQPVSDMGHLGHQGDGTQGHWGTLPTCLSHSGITYESRLPRAGSPPRRYRSMHLNSLLRLLSKRTSKIKGKKHSRPNVYLRAGCHREVRPILR